MAERRFLAKQRTVRNAVREDVLFFLLPAGLVYVAGMVVSARHLYDGLVAATGDLIRDPVSLFLLSWQNIVGLALVISGLAVCFVAAATLRRNYASTLVVREDHKLITHGIYRLARHPIYLGALMVSIGVPVYSSSPYGLLIMSALIPLVLNRIRIEERMLTDQFGDAYRKYRAATSKLIPFVN